MQSRQQVLRQVQHALGIYDAQMRQSNIHQGDAIREAGDHFLDVLQKTDALQAQLVVAGYLLCGGKNVADTAVMETARAIQMVHCSLDKAIAGMPASGIGLHAAEIILANTAAELRLKTLSITNRSLLLHAQAATTDAPNPDLLATEAVLNPLHVGMVLAGADCDATDAITSYALTMGCYYVTHSARYLQDAKTARKQLTFWSQTELQLVDDIFKSLS